MWTTKDAEALYAVDAGGDGFFFVNAAGRAAVKPFAERDLAIDIAEVVAEAANRGVRGPVLLRFQDVLRARVQRLNEA